MSNSLGDDERAASLEENSGATSSYLNNPIRSEATVRAARVKELSANEREVICERHFGWEGASVTLLAAVFGVSRQKIAAILAQDARAASTPGALR